jgi:hypothetical protein
MALAAREAAANTAGAAGAGGAVEAVLDECGGDEAGVERMHESQATAERAALHREVAPT